MLVSHFMITYLSAFGKFKGSSALLRAHGKGGASATILFLEAPPPEKSAGGFQQAGKKEGVLGEGIFARLLTAPKARLWCERLRSLAPSREAKQNIFQFPLEEKGSRTKIEKREKCFALRRRQAGGAAGQVSSVQSRFALRSVIAIYSLTGMDVFIHRNFPGENCEDSVQFPAARSL